MERFGASGVHWRTKEDRMLQKIVTIALLTAALGTAACNTVRGAAADVNSVANCTENAINGTKPC
jgi:entericidin B